jgi:hypothetical protein
MPVDLSKYKPYPVDLRVEDIRDARSRLVAYLQDQWRDVDFRPRSPFGDLFMTPAAYMETALNKAATRFLNDLDPNQIRIGRYYNEETVRLLFRILGVTDGQDLPGYGLVMLLFSSPETRTLEAPLKFYKGRWSCSTMDGGGDESSITINAPGASVEDGPYRLTPVGNGFHRLYLPVYTDQPTVPQMGTELEWDGNPPEGLSRILVANTFTRPVLETDPRKMVNRASRQFARPGFSMRANLISYVSTCFPEIKYVGVYGTGDPEITRRRRNLLGVATPETDIYVRETNSLLWRDDTVLVKYDPESSSWKGPIDTPTGICLFDREAVYRSNTFENERGSVNFYSGSKDPALLPDQAAFSLKATHAVEMIDVAPESQVKASTPVINFEVQGNTYQLLAEGQYVGNMFEANHSRSLRLSFSEYKEIEYKDGTYWCLILFAQDVRYGDNGKLVFRAAHPNTNSPATMTCNQSIVDQADVGLIRDYVRLAGGLDLTLVRTSAAIDEAPAFAREVLSSLRFNYSFQAQTARVNVRYAYDPAVFKLTHRGRDIQMSHTRDMLVRSFCPSEVVDFRITITVSPTGELDRAKISQAIADYVNSIAHPDRYQESDIFRAIEPYGVEGIDSVDPVIIHHTTPADYFYQSATQTNVNKTVSRSFLDVPYAAGHSPRNHMFYMRPDVVKLVRRNK